MKRNRKQYRRIKQNGDTAQHENITVVYFKSNKKIDWKTLTFLSDITQMMAINYFHSVAEIRSMSAIHHTAKVLF